MLESKMQDKVLPSGTTFVWSGDIKEMNLRDSAAQVWPYLPY